MKYLDEETITYEQALKNLKEKAATADINENNSSFENFKTQERKILEKKQKI